MRDAEIRTLIDRPADSLLRMMLASAPCAASIGIDGKIVYSNEACAQMWGYENSTDMIDVPFYTLIEPEWHPLVNLIWTIGGNRSVPWRYELEGVKTDGTKFPYRITATSLDLLVGKATFAYFEPIDSCTSYEEQCVIIRRLAGDLEL